MHINKNNLVKYFTIVLCVILAIYLTSNTYLIGNTFSLINIKHVRHKNYVKPKQSIALTAELTDTFIRLTSDSNSMPIAFEVASASYKPIDDSDLTVDLIGAVHFADKEYYENLNQTFQNYDAVLYELIAPVGVKPDPSAELSKLGQVQFFLADLMSLDPQLTAVNYHAKNFVHADTSPEQLKKIAKNRGDDSVSILMGVVRDFVAISAQNKTIDPSNEFNAQSALKLLLNPLELRRTFAKGLTDKNTANMFEHMKTLKTYLLDERNNHALKILEHEINNGKKKIAIFYGSAHLNDLEKKLMTEFGLKRNNIVWHKAWDLKSVPRESNSELIRMIQMFSKVI